MKLFLQAPRQPELFPDGTLIDSWFYETGVPEPEESGRLYCLTEHGILDDGKLYTAQIQALIDEAAAAGGGCIVVPAGTYRTGALSCETAFRVRSDPERCVLSDFLLKDLSISALKFGELDGVKSLTRENICVAGASAEDRG